MKIAVTTILTRCKETTRNLRQKKLIFSHKENAKKTLMKKNRIFKDP